MVIRKVPVILVLELYPEGDGGSMYANIENWRPVSVNIAIDPEARTFAEGVRQMVVKAMKKKLRGPRLT